MGFLGLFGPPNVEKLAVKQDVAGLIRALGYGRRSDDWRVADVRSQAARALGEIGDARAVRFLIRVLDDRNSGPREAAALALGGIGDPEALESLGAAFDEGSSDDVRKASVVAVGRIGGPRAVELLVAALGNDREGVRSAAVAALRGMGWNPTTNEDRARYWIAAGEFARCAEIGAAAVDPLIRVLRVLPDNHYENSSRARLFPSAAEALGKIGDARAVEPLISVFDCFRHYSGDQRDEARASAARALGAIGDARAVAPLITALADNYKVSSAADEALEKLGPPAVDPLIRVLASGDELTASRAAQILGRVGDARAVEPLILALANRDSEVRQSAAVALGRIGDSRAVEPLTRALVDGDADARKVAVGALGAIGDSRAIKPLGIALADESLEVGEGAAAALGAIGGARAVDLLGVALGGKSRFVREHAAIALGAIGDARSVELLAVALADEADEVDEVRLRAAIALGKLGDPRAVEPLISLLGHRHKWERRAVAEVLVALHTGGALTAAARSAILGARPRIEERHSDAWWCKSHGDEGVGVAFPL